MKRPDLLKLLSRMGSNGRAEAEQKKDFCKMFYPPKEQIGALDPDVSLILGARGSGKTALFRAVTEFKLTETLRARNPNARIHPKSEWVPVDLNAKEYPNQIHLRTFFEETTLTEDQTHDYWQCVLIRALWNNLDGSSRQECRALKDAEATTTDLQEVGQEFSQNAAKALDRLDDRLETEGCLMFVGFDELDLLVNRNGRAASTLVGFWASRWRRWKGIRAKLFLRSDIYRRFINEGGADLAKISANRFELKWSDESLLAMLVKRILNTNVPTWQSALQLTGRRAPVQDETLGASLRTETLPELHRVLHDILGPYMGANRKKGASEKWIIEHIKDCLEKTSPRSLVRLFEFAADRQLGDNIESKVILAPSYLRQALDTVSNEHVLSCMNEWPWLVGLRNRLGKWTSIRQVPMERKPFEAQIRKTWDEPWNPDPLLAAPPCEDPQSFIPLLIEIGILRERKDGRLDTTDLYLDGVGFKRKGGVRRRIAEA
jgi:hypothetical protein